MSLQMPARILPTCVYEDSFQSAMRHLQDVRASLGDMQAELEIKNAGLFLARHVSSFRSLCQADLDSFLKSLTAADEYNAFLQAVD